MTLDEHAVIFNKKNDSTNKLLLQWYTVYISFPFVPNLKYQHLPPKKMLKIQVKPKCLVIQQQTTKKKTFLITRYFPHIPEPDVNSFSNRVTGLNPRPVSCDEGEFPVCWYTTEHAFSESCDLRPYSTRERARWKTPSELFSTFKRLMQQ